MIGPVRNYCREQPGYPPLATGLVLLVLESTIRDRVHRLKDSRRNLFETQRHQRTQSLENYSFSPWLLSMAFSLCPLCLCVFNLLVLCTSVFSIFEPLDKSVHQLLRFAISQVVPCLPSWIAIPIFLSPSRIASEVAKSRLDLASARK